MQTPHEGGNHPREAGPSLQFDMGGAVIGQGPSETGSAPSGEQPGPLKGRYSRRWFLAVGSATTAALLAGLVLDQVRKTDPTVSAQASVILMNAKGVLIADPTRCVGCRRCELACTEYNKGKSQPTIANIKVARNLNFGAKSASLGYDSAKGSFGNHLVVQDTCKQCPHPVPCATTCPQGAIVTDEKTFARVVDEARCVGCGFCQMACPWEMMSFDSETNKAQKCNLCGGNPECVAACPTGALKYMAWTDLTKKVPARVAVTGLTRSTSNEEACGACHN